MARGRKYGDKDIERGLQALAEHSGNAEAASKQTGIPARTLRGWKQHEFADEFAEVRREKRSGFIEEVWAAAKEALAELRKRLPEMNGKDLAVTVGILTDKGLVLGGEAAAISEQREGPTIYLPQVDDEQLETKSRSAGEVSSEPGV